MLSVSPSRYWFDVKVIFQSGNRNAGTSEMTATRIITRLLSVSGSSKNAFALSSQFFLARPSVVARSVAPSPGTEYCVIAIRRLIESSISNHGDQGITGKGNIDQPPRVPVFHLVELSLPPTITSLWPAILRP